MATRTDDETRVVDVRKDDPAPPPPSAAGTDETQERVTVERDETPPREGVVVDALRFLLAGALLAVLVMFAVANDASAELDYIVATDTVPLVWPLAGAMAGGALLALLLRRRA